MNDKDKITVTVKIPSWVKEFFMNSVNITFQTKSGIIISKDILSIDGKQVLASKYEGAYIYDGFMFDNSFVK